MLVSCPKERHPMKIAKPSFGPICLAIPASDIATMSGRSETRTMLPQAAPLGHAPAGFGVQPR